MQFNSNTALKFGTFFSAHPVYFITGQNAKVYHTTFNPYWQIPVEEDQQGRTQGEGPGARALPLGPTQY